MWRRCPPITRPSSSLATCPRSPPLPWKTSRLVTSVLTRAPVANSVGLPSLRHPCVSSCLSKKSSEPLNVNSPTAALSAPMFSTRRRLLRPSADLCVSFHKTSKQKNLFFSLFFFIFRIIGRVFNQKLIFLIEYKIITPTTKKQWAILSITYFALAWSLRIPLPKQFLIPTQLQRIRNLKNCLSPSFICRLFSWLEFVFNLMCFVMITLK